MYHPSVIQRNVEKIEAATGFNLVRHTYAHSEEWTANVRDAWDLSKNALNRPLTEEETSFITNERLMCQWDYRYWCERYNIIEIDGVLGGGIGPLRIGESQEPLLKKIAKAELEETEKIRRGETADGILIADHKARQVWHTALCRSISMHRATLHPNSKCLAGSVDDDKIQELYERDMRCYENLPWFLRPELEFNEKNEHLSFKIGSKIQYMISSKKSSYGQGIQYGGASHVTELSEFENPARLEVDFFPTIPQSPTALLVLESRANGRDNWWRFFTESVRKGNKPRWRYNFTPWYAETRKYRRTPPDGWKPSDVAMLHAKKVYETSAEFVGKSIYLPKEQLYWWETQRAEYIDSGTLNFFLTNFCATPEESFQHAGESAFDAELLDELRLKARNARPYEFATEKDPEQTIWVPNCGGLRPMRPSEMDGDARGIVWLAEEPNPSASYFIGCDPTKGIISWNRAFRKESDHNTDNGTIEVIRVGRNGLPDGHAAEFAAPMDAEDLADVVNALGRIFCGSNEDGQAMANIEVYPGPGEPTQRRLITHYGYTNLYVAPKYSNTIVAEYRKNVAGWISSQQSRQELWRRGVKHVALKRIGLFSGPLIEEMADCKADSYLWTETARARYGKKDDRVVAFFLAIYAAHDWGQDDVETKKVSIETGGSGNWQAMGMTSAQMFDAWEDRFQQLLGD